MSERAGAERRVDLEQAKKVAQAGRKYEHSDVQGLCDYIDELADELRAAWQSEDFWKEEFRKHVDDAEAAGYRRGLAAARAALEAMLADLEKSAQAIAEAEGCAVDSWPVKYVRKCIAVIDALAAGVQKEDGK